MKISLSKKKLASGIAILTLGAVAVSTVVFAAGGGPGGGMGGPGGGNMGQVELSESVISVKLQTPTTGGLTRSTEFIGKIEPAESVSVYPETSGKVTEIYFEAGQTVQKGELLFTIDDTDAQLAYQIAQASYEQKQISADTTLGSNYESKVASAKSQLESAQQNLNNARLKLKDYNDGYDDSLLSAERAAQKAQDNMQAYDKTIDELKDKLAGAGESEKEAIEKEIADYEEKYNQAYQDYSMYYNAVKDLEDDEDSEARDLRNSYNTAKTNYQQALDNYNLVTGGSYEDTEKATEAELKSAQLSLEQSASSLDKYKVYAPISGVIESKNITANEPASTQNAAFVISNKDTLTVKFNASADAATALSIGDEVTVTKGSKEYTATIIEIDSKADDSTGLFPVKARIEDGDGSLLTGVSVKVTAATQKVEDAILVPIDLVYYDDGQAYVFTYADGKAHRTDFETGMSNSETVVAVSGLSLDSEIITTWHPDLKDGAAVELAEGQEAPAAAPDSAPGAEPTESRSAKGTDAPDAAAAPNAPEMPAQED
ncbi:efflux RND transporter periplasmic adaptor subunit [Anaerotruncus rubiinfantis]|uniref:efflux RND transporter periplasmic adaptor subunit n=1 Tax=Anaerotruncus rubiinfantis TaxID=1720200 RepID=UPI001896D828|nr:efflux RND transporter periplasmic adaptor subunit [Anaerotruncus rubiinfantis]